MEVVRQGGGVILVKRGVVGTLVRVGVLARGLSLWVVVVVAVVVGAVTLARLVVVVAPITLHPNLMAITPPHKGTVIFTLQTKPVATTPNKAMAISTSHINTAETTPTKARAKAKAVDKEEGEGVEEEAHIKILGRFRRLRQMKCYPQGYTHTHISKLV